MLGSSSSSYHLSEPRQPFATAKFHLDASLVRVTIPETRDSQRGGGARSDIGGYSYQSRKRFMLFLNTITRDCPLPLFVTLTYPAEFTAEPREWKRHLKNFGQWMRDRFPRAAYAWKLEPQQRGAPHFHLMVWGLPWLPWQVLAVRWCEIVAGVDLAAPVLWSKGQQGAAEFRLFCECVREVRPDLVDHLRAGTECRQVRSRNGVKCYAGKKYMGKEVEGMSGVGRFWGIHNRRFLPRPAPVVESAPRPAVRTFARIARRFLKTQKGYSARHSRSVDIFTEYPDQWQRLFVAVCRGKVGLRGRVLTRTQSSAIERAGATAARGFREIEAPSARLEKPEFIWD